RALLAGHGSTSPAYRGTVPDPAPIASPVDSESGSARAVRHCRCAAWARADLLSSHSWSVRGEDGCRRGAPRKGTDQRQMWPRAAGMIAGEFFRERSFERGAYPLEGVLTQLLR